MIIRKHQENDRDQIIALLRLNTPTYFSAREEADLIYYLDEHAHNYYVAEREDLILGCAGFNISPDGLKASLSWDIIHPQAQGQGIGSELTYFRIQEIKKIPTIQIISVRTSQLVYPFYEKFNLVLEHVVKDYWDTGFDLYHLQAPIESVPAQRTNPGNTLIKPMA